MCMRFACVQSLCSAMVFVVMYALVWWWCVCACVCVCTAKTEGYVEVAERRMIRQLVMGNGDWWSEAGALPHTTNIHTHT